MVWMDSQYLRRTDKVYHLLNHQDWNSHSQMYDKVQNNGLLHEHPCIPQYKDMNHLGEYNSHNKFHVEGSSSEKDHGYTPRPAVIEAPVQK